MKHFPFFWLLVVSLMWSCTKSNPEPKRTPILEVEGKFLYKDDLEKVIPKTANKIDSTEIAERYIKKWVTDVLMYENGRRNLQNASDIDKQVEEYRKTLVIHQYEQALIEERVKNSVTEQEMQQFYTTYSSQFALQDNLVKGVLLILPKNAQNIDQARAWVKSSNEKSLENLEKYSLTNAISFDYMNEWTPFSEVIKKAPFKVEDSRSFISQKSFSEISDSTKVYMLRVTHAAVTGQTEPFEEAREKIKTIMMNKRQSDFVIQFENDIYNDAVKDGAINFFEKR